MTPLEKITPYLEELDHVLIMTVEPGFAGSTFTPISVKKLEALIEILEDNKQISIGVDGAIGHKEIEHLGSLGATHFVLGTTALFKGDLADSASQVIKLKNQLEKVK